MTDATYYPELDFLNAIIAENLVLVGDPFAESNLSRLIAMTRDEDYSNRDWATMLLAGVEIDTPEIRSALLSASRDPDSVIRGEALCGLAERDRLLALPLVMKELTGDHIAVPTLMAAQEIAHTDLAAPLREWLTVDPGDQSFSSWILWALAACGSPGITEHDQLSA